MAVSSTLAQIIQQILSKTGLGTYIPAADIDSGSASAVVSVKWFRGLSGSNHFTSKQSIFWRPTSATAADNIRYAGTLTVSTGSVAPDTNWADSTWTSEDLYVVNYGIHPQRLIDAINLALRMLYGPRLLPLSPFTDGDMVTSGVSNYTSVGTPATKEKVTTAARTRFTQALHLLNDADGEGAITTSLLVDPSSSWYAWAIAAADVGTAQMIPYDVTNSAAIETVEYTGERPALLEKRIAIPATCETFAVRVLGELDAADTYWSAVGAYCTSDYWTDLPSGSLFDETFKFERLYSASFRTNLDDGVASAMSMHLTEIPHSDYQFFDSSVAANNPGIQWNTREHFGKPILIEGRAPRSAEITFGIDDLTDTVAERLNLVEAAARVELFGNAEIRSRVPDGDVLWAQARADFESQRPTVHREDVGQKNSYFVGGLRS